jgi:hypothetical protein
MVLVGACALALSIAPAVARAEVPNVPWTSLLPPLSSPNGPERVPQPGCETPGIDCVDGEIARMREAQELLGCDHRAVFATTYLELTRVLRTTLESEPGFFADPGALIDEDVLFADYYFRMLADDEAGRRVAPAWRIALDVTRRGSTTAAIDMLLGINAHVQNDMPFVIAELGLRSPDGVTRKGDHDRFNEVLNRAYGDVVHAIAERYDPFVSLTNSDLTPLDDLAGLELVKVWREGVWRNAERLANARTAAQRARVARSIEAQAAATALTIAAPSTMPGYRAERDAYCSSRLGSGA